MYCKKCKNLFEDDACPFCGNTDVGEPYAGDFCLLTECNATSAEMLKGALESEGIACELLPAGSGVRSAQGQRLENYTVYVQYEHLDSASDVLDGMFCHGTADYKQSLVGSFDRWHLQKDSHAKKYKKALKLEKDADLFDFCRSVVERASDIHEDGIIPGCPQEGYHLVVNADNAVLMFNSKTFELIYAKIRK